MMQRECPVCGISLADAHRLRITCSERCKDVAKERRRRERLQADCVPLRCCTCGIELPARTGAGRNRLTCSRTCWLEWHRKKKGQAQARRPRKPKKSLGPCTICGEEIHHPNRKYTCSTRCSTVRKRARAAARYVADDARRAADAARRRSERINAPERMRLRRERERIKRVQAKAALQVLTDLGLMPLIGEQRL